MEQVLLERAVNPWAKKDIEKTGFMPFPIGNYVR
jgi:hypothetical protein